MVTAENAILAAVIWLVVRLEWTRSDLQTLSRRVEYQDFKLDALWMAIVELYAKLELKRPRSDRWPPFGGEGDPPR